MVSAGSMATGGKVSRQFNTIQTVPVDVVRKYESVMLNTRHGVCVCFSFFFQDASKTCARVSTAQHVAGRLPVLQGGGAQCC